VFFHLTIAMHHRDRGVMWSHKKRSVRGGHGVCAKNQRIEMMCQYLAYSLALCILYCIILSGVAQIASFSGLQEEGMCPFFTS